MVGLVETLPSATVADRATYAPAAATAFPPAVALSGLHKRFGATIAVDGLDLEVAAGQTLALLGPNGAGKSTTIGMMLGLIAPDAGTVRLLGESPRGAIAAGRVGVMLQEAGLMAGVSVGELLAFARGLYPAPLPLNDLVEAAGLAEILDRRVDKLSGGQAQRLRFALAVAGNPDLIVLDEPTVAMDVEGRHAFWERMRLLAAAGKTIVFATHYLDEAELAADRVVIIARGRIVADGSVAAIKASIGERRVRLTLPHGHDEALRLLHGVSRVERYGGKVTLYTTDSDATIRDLVEHGLPWRDLDVEAADLEDAFLTLTGEAR